MLLSTFYGLSAAESLSVSLGGLMQVSIGTSELKLAILATQPNYKNTPLIKSQRHEGTKFVLRI